MINHFRNCEYCGEEFEKSDIDEDERENFKSSYIKHKNPTKR